MNRKVQKKQTTGINKNRNAQSENIARLDTKQNIEKWVIPLLVLIQKKRSFREFVSSGNSLYNRARHYFRS